jgi:hypothetical protein
MNAAQRFNTAFSVHGRLRKTRLDDSRLPRSPKAADSGDCFARLDCDFAKTLALHSPVFATYRTDHEFQCPENTAMDAIQRELVSIGAAVYASITPAKVIAIPVENHKADLASLK